jgi:hypothetical protein
VPDQILARRSYPHEANADEGTQKHDSRLRVGFAAGGRSVPEIYFGRGL